MIFHPRFEGVMYQADRQMTGQVVVEYDGEFYVAYALRVFSLAPFSNPQVLAVREDNQWAIRIEGVIYELGVQR